MRAVLLIGLVLAGGCGSRARPIALTDESGSEGGASGTVTTYSDPQIDGHQVAQCVIGQGWGAFDRKRCDADRQRIVARQFCVEQQPNAFEVSWTLQHGPSGRLSIWMYGREADPTRGTWTRGRAVDRFSEIRCETP